VSSSLVNKIKGVGYKTNNMFAKRDYWKSHVIEYCSSMLFVLPRHKSSVSK